MEKKIRNTLKAILVLSVIFMLILISISFYENLRNYYGYCDRYGDRKGARFSTEERLDIAIDHYIARQYYDYHEIGQVERKDNPPRSELKKIFELIPYQSKSEFLKENPDCCELDQLYFDFWDRAAGSGNGTFVFKHKIRYRMPDGTTKEIVSQKTTIDVNNCGYPSVRSSY